MVFHGVGVRAATPTVRGMRAIQLLDPSSTIRSRANIICGRIQFLLKSELHQISSLTVAVRSSFRIHGVEHEHDR